MEEPGTSELTDDVQETQFASPELVREVIGDEENVQQQQSLQDVSNVQIILVDNTTQTQIVGYGATDVGNPHPSASTTRLPSARVLAPDLFRGFIMFLQSIDHSSVASGAWAHGQAIESETESTRMTMWNIPIAYTARTFTHLCAPGFMFLLGMGVVYLGRSRSKLGWSNLRILRHFAIRAVVLAIVNCLLGMTMLFQIFPILNIVLLALAFNYFFAGLIWLAMTYTEPLLSRVLGIPFPDQSRDLSAQQPLLTDPDRPTADRTTGTVASKISFHIHNIILLVLFGITMWWNIWFDPQHGSCHDLSQKVPAMQSNSVFEFFFRVIVNEFIVSVFPPLAWIAPAILGLLYGRIITSRSWKNNVVNSGNLLAGLIFMVLFVLTRVLRFGNLDESCLAMSEHLRHPDVNQHLASVKSFFYLTKYPPSPSYIFFTMGTNFTLLALFGLVSSKAAQYVPLSILLVYGTSALFFYALHLLIYEVLGTWVKKLFGKPMPWDDMGKPGQHAIGVGPGVVYLATWLLGLLILYPACRWYGRFKAGKDADSLWRFF